jgi:hypothetical protein
MPVGSLATDIASANRPVHGSTRETLLCKRNIAQTKMAGLRKGAAVAAAAHAAATDSILNINITTSSFPQLKRGRRC